ncbi:MAG TPA: acetyl esterase, partial [Rariglobus sp.]
QGESNVGKPSRYQASLETLINDWRTRWHEGDFPFYLCQLPGFTDPQPQPRKSNWAELREAQSRTTALPNTGLAVLIDLGESRDIHPHNKADVGERLARLALAKTYGRDLVFSGPVYAGMKIEGDRIRLHFEHTQGGLVAGPTAPGVILPAIVATPLPQASNELKGFIICGENRSWVWADARIENDDIVVSSPSVPRPVAVRYAWADNPVCNLYNQAGLPAAPFRTDATAPSAAQ